MVDDKILFSTIIKKYKTESDNSIRITIPKSAIQVSNSVSDFFEVRAYSNRIEIRPHEFKFVSEKKEAPKKKESPSKEEKPVTEIIEPEVVETSEAENNDSSNDSDDSMNDILDQIDQG